MYEITHENSKQLLRKRQTTLGILFCRTLYMLSKPQNSGKQTSTGVQTNVHTVFDQSH